MIPKSDKFYWHKYIDFYEQKFESRTISRIAEIGVFRGDSLRWLLERFPQSQIYAMDLLPISDEWPQHKQIKYFQLDQSIQSHLERFFLNGPFDLIIEDGSHDPGHQWKSLVLGIKSITSGGIYIVEDLHTSHPNHAQWVNSTYRGEGLSANIFNILLALEHSMQSKKHLSDASISELAENSTATKEEIELVARAANKVWFYRRSVLPDYCYSCQTAEFDYVRLVCKCGSLLYEEADSITAIIEVYNGN